MFISSDISFEQRQQDANFRTVVNDLGRDHDQSAYTTHERRSDQFQSRNAHRNDRNSERHRNPGPSRY